MRAAGLTHGGLYSQFGSKEELIAEVLNLAFDAAAARANHPTSPAAAVAAYLSPEHRDHPGSGCFMAALGCEIPSQSDRVREAFTRIVRRNVDALACYFEPKQGNSPQDRALALVATMVGALVLARAVNDQVFSDRILAVSRARSLESF
jgi:TetR/AcrR family transcriptional repressor of nem operon